MFLLKIAPDKSIWLRARALTIWQATFEFCQIADKNSSDALLQKRIID